LPDCECSITLHNRPSAARPPFTPPLPLCTHTSRSTPKRHHETHQGNPPEWLLLLVLHPMQDCFYCRCYLRCCYCCCCCCCYSNLCTNAAAALLLLLQLLLTNKCIAATFRYSPAKHTHSKSPPHTHTHSTSCTKRGNPHRRLLLLVLHLMHNYC
jgi:hypothetical protein